MKCLRTVNESESARYRTGPSREVGPNLPGDSNGASSELADALVADQLRVRR